MSASTTTTESDMPKNLTWLLFLDELKGFAKSSVMLAMWVGMPLMGIGLYYLLPSGLPVNTFTDDKFVIPASAFLSVMLSSIAGLLAATLVSIEIVNEKNKKIYDLFLIRPINRGSFMWAKFFAVFFCVSVAMVFALCGGLLLDVTRGIPLSPMVLESILDSTLAAIGVIMVSTAAGILIGMISKTVIIAVMLVWFVGQYVMLIPMLAALIPVEWVQGVTYGLTLIFTVIMVTAASMIFKRMEV